MDKKPGSRGVVDSIARLRNLRYMTKGPGAKHAAPAKPTVDQLRDKVQTVVYGSKSLKPQRAQGSLQETANRVYPKTKKKKAKKAKRGR